MPAARNPWVVPFMGLAVAASSCGANPSRPPPYQPIKQIRGVLHPVAGQQTASRGIVCHHRRALLEAQDHDAVEVVHRIERMRRTDHRDALS